MYNCENKYQSNLFVMFRHKIVHVIPFNLRYRSLLLSVYHHMLMFIYE